MKWWTKEKDGVELNNAEGRDEEMPLGNDSTLPGMVACVEVTDVCRVPM